MAYTTKDFADFSSTYKNKTPNEGIEALLAHGFMPHSSSSSTYLVYYHPQVEGIISIPRNANHLGPQIHSKIIAACRKIGFSAVTAHVESFRQSEAVYFEDLPEIRKYISYDSKITKDERDYIRTKALSELENLVTDRDEPLLEQYRRLKKEYETDCGVKFHYDKSNHEIIIAATDSGILKHIKYELRDEEVQNQPSYSDILHAVKATLSEVDEVLSRRFALLARFIDKDDIGGSVNETQDAYIITTPEINGRTKEFKLPKLSPTGHLTAKAEEYLHKAIKTVQEQEEVKISEAEKAVEEIAIQPKATPTPEKSFVRMVSMETFSSHLSQNAIQAKSDMLDVIRLLTGIEDTKEALEAISIGSDYPLDKKVPAKLYILGQYLDPKNTLAPTHIDKTALAGFCKNLLEVVAELIDKTTEKLPASKEKILACFKEDFKTVQKQANQPVPRGAADVIEKTSPGFS